MSTLATLCMIFILFMLIEKKNKMLKYIRLIYWLIRAKIVEYKYNKMGIKYSELRDIADSIFLEEMPDYFPEATEFLNILHEENSKFCSYAKRYNDCGDKYILCLKNINRLS